MVSIKFGEALKQFVTDRNFTKVPLDSQSIFVFTVPYSPEDSSGLIDAERDFVIASVLNDQCFELDFVRGVF